MRFLDFMRGHWFTYGGMMLFVLMLLGTFLLAQGYVHLVRVGGEIYPCLTGDEYPPNPDTGVHPCDLDPN